MPGAGNLAPVRCAADGSRPTPRLGSARTLGEHGKEGTIEAIALVARLKPGTESQAAALIESGPPFDPPSLGLLRHRVFLSAGEVVFVFEGHQVEWAVDDLVSDPSAWATHEALEAWRPLIESPPRIAREAYTWEETS